MQRPEWDEIWIDFAKTIAKRSYDPRFQVGAVVVAEDNTQVLAIPHEPESMEPGCSGFIHAEVNALIKLDFNNPKKKKMYLTLSPCRQCAKAIINAGVKEVIYLEKYRDLSGVQLLTKCGIEVRQFFQGDDSYSSEESRI